MFNAALNLSAEALAKEVCDRLIKKGLLKAKPEFIRKDREAKLAEIFGKANLDGGTLPSIGGRRRLEVHLLSVTAGEACAWLGNVISELAEIVQDGVFQVGSGHGEVQPLPLANKAALTAVEGRRKLELLGSEDLASQVCDRLVERGLPKAENTSERHDREVGISSLLRSAQVDGESLAGFCDQRSLEQHLLGITGSDARVHLESDISDLADMLFELAFAEVAGATESTTVEADRSGSIPFETAIDGLDNRDLGTSNSTASPPQSRGPPRLEAMAAWVCRRLVEKGQLKTKPAFVRTDREANICALLRKAGLEGAALTAYSDGRSLHLRLQGALKGEACAWLDNTVAELVELSQVNHDFDKFDPTPAQKLPVKGEHTGAGVDDTPRSMASCSTSDCVKEIPAQKRVSFSAAPAEVLHVVPYSEMYILHPDKFEFDSYGRYITDDDSIDANLRSADRPA